ncbi:acetate--CoA ligase family protein [Desulfoferrobacter suflitae]|uniref:acetate--CoA ligase family protein n=1 Tax=Desulfoferrobacter suflitae TaxID=2865782 RepID=UPI002164781C|nr:acetate--CoA ligase [Desulfoferrobacter suflitae]MCK8601425.1 acetate--CoA ligase family protein [Desulfoferrobacter suflitae]
MNGLDAIFSPQAIAVVGASTTPGKVGHDIFSNILKGGYTGTLYPVNPHARSVLSVRAYAALDEIPDEVDLAIIILPPRAALESVKQSIAKGVEGIVIVSAGFRETGEQGAEIENRIVSLCREAGVRMVGPNCLGVINPLESVRMNASFSTRMPAAGKISFISQSGALCTAVLDFAADRDFGFSKFISIGNKADVDELDLLQYLHEDIDTEVIMIYLEELRRGREFIEAVKEITSGRRRTPVLVIKSGRTSAGARAAASHTGALAGSEAVYDSIFEQSGIIRAESIHELFDFASAFTYKSSTALGKVSRKLPAGNRVAIVTNAGGPGIVATDMTITAGLELAGFQDETIESLREHLPSTANIHNPVDVIGDATQERYENALNAVLKDEGVDGALVILTPQSMTDALGIAKAIARIARGSRKPMLSCFMGIVDVSEGVQFLQEHGYPVFRFPEDAAKAFGALYRYSKWLNRHELKPFKLQHDRAQAAKIIDKHMNAGKRYVGEVGGLDLLKCYGFNVLPTELARTAEEAVEIAANIGFPVVLKIVSEQIVHKSDAGGVLLNLRDQAAVQRGFLKIVENAGDYSSEAVIDGVLVQKMAPQGEEVIFGMNRYPIFGPLLMFGMGGIFVEVFQDVKFSLAPVTREEAVRMIHDIKGFRLLNGFRGRPRADIDALEKLLVSMSHLAVNHPEICEMDLNPLLVHPEGEGVTVADCRIILQQPAAACRPG